MFSARLVKNLTRNLDITYLFPIAFAVFFYTLMDSRSPGWWRCRTIIDYETGHLQPPGLIGIKKKNYHWKISGVG